MAEVADDAGGFPGFGEAGSGFGGAEAEDEAVHFCDQGADFTEGRAEGLGEGFATGNGGGGGGDEFFEVGGFLGEEGGVGGIEAVFGEGGGIGGEGGGELAVDEPGFGDEFDIAKALPGAEGEVDGGGVGFAALVLEPSDEGFADLMGAVFEFLFLAILVSGVTGGAGLLGGDEAGEGVNLGPEGGGAGGEEHGFLVLPGRLVGEIGQQGEEGEMHVLAIAEFVFHGMVRVVVIVGSGLGERDG